MDESSAAEIQPYESLSESLPHVELLRPHIAAARPRTEDHELPNALGGFVASARPWSSQTVVLSRRTTAALWVLVGAGAGVCAVLFGLLSEAACSGVACSVATLGGHPRLTLALAAVGTVGLLVGALFTRGLTRVGARGLWLVVPAAVLTAASVVGAVVVLAAAVLIVIVGAIAVGIVCAVIADRS